MQLKGFKVWLCAIIFAIIQMIADVIKAIYQENYVIMILEGATLVWMCWLGKWAYRQNKRKKANG